MAIIDGNSPKQTVIDTSRPILDAWYPGDADAEGAAHVSEAPAYDLDSATGIMAFYAEKSGELRKERRKLLDASQRNSKISKELNQLMADIREGSKKHNFADLAVEAAKFLKSHRDDANYEQLREAIQPMIDRFVAAAEVHQDEDGSATHDQQRFHDEHLERLTDRTNFDRIRANDQTVGDIMASNYYDAFEKKIQGLIDDYSHDDALTQMSLADIQAKLGQAATLASNVLKSMNDTISGIIGTMRG